GRGAREPVPRAAPVRGRRVSGDRSRRGIGRVRGVAGRLGEVRNPASEDVAKKTHRTVCGSKGIGQLSIHTTNATSASRVRKYRRNALACSYSTQSDTVNASITSLFDRTYEADA